MTAPEWGQLINAVASTIACVLWLVSIPSTMRLGSPAVVAATIVSVAITAWYAIINFILVTKLALVDSATEVIPFFRFAFPLVVVAPALRSLAYRPLAKRLEEMLGDAWDRQT